jgi:hypothetical protein
LPPGQPDLAELWSQLLDSVSRASPFMKAYFVEARPVSFVNNVLTIGFDPDDAGHLHLVDNPRTRSLVQTKLAELHHPNAQVKFIQADAPLPAPAPPAPAPTPAPAAPAAPAPPIPDPPTAAAEPPKAPKSPPQPASPKKDDFKNDPLIQKALEIFKGQIVEVRS